MPAPDPAVWAFNDRNDTLCARDNQIDPAGPKVTAEEWVRKGPGEIQRELEKALELERVMSRKSRRGTVHSEHGYEHHHHGGHAAAGRAGTAGAAGGAAGGVPAEQ